MSDHPAIAAVDRALAAIDPALAERYPGVAMSRQSLLAVREKLLTETELRCEVGEMPDDRQDFDALADVPNQEYKA